MTDTFSLSLCTNKFIANTVFSATAPRVTYADTSLGIMNTHANTLLSSPDFGFREASETIHAGTNFRTNANAVLVLASRSDPGVVVGDSLFGVTSSANAIVKAVRRAYNSTNVLAVDTFKNFQASETVKKSTSTAQQNNTVVQVVSLQTQ